MEANNKTYGFTVALQEIGETIPSALLAELLHWADKSVALWQETKGIPGLLAAARLIRNSLHGQKSDFDS
jgi:hypothetical protein